MFSILNSLLLRSLPVRQPQQLARVMQKEQGSWTNPIWEQIRERQALFGGAAAWSAARFNIAGGGETQFVDGLWASGSYFDMLGVAAILGRTFTPTDDRRGGGPDGPVAVIGYQFWQRRFGGATDVIGRSLTVERVPFTIVGVAPPEFFGTDVGRTFDVAIPIGTEPLIRGKESWLDRRSTWWLSIIIRQRQDQDLAAAVKALTSVQPQIREATIPDSRAGQTTLPVRFPGTAARVNGHVVSPQALSATTHDDHVRGVAGAADRLRQHRESSARARLGAASRAQHPCGARRFALPSGPAAL